MELFSSWVTISCLSRTLSHNCTFSMLHRSMELSIFVDFATNGRYFYLNVDFFCRIRQLLIDNLQVLSQPVIVSL